MFSVCEAFISTIVNHQDSLLFTMWFASYITDLVAWQQIEIDDMQFGFMKSKGTTDGIFMAGQMQENFRVKGKKLYFGFVDLEKAFDRVPREVISWAMRKLGVEEWLVSAVMSMYTVSQKKQDTKLLPIISPNVN